MVALNFLILRAPFLAIIQLLVYAGAIMVLYLFVIMLLNLKLDEVKEEIAVNRKVFAAIASIGLFLLLGWAIRSQRPAAACPGLTRGLPRR